jgi:hypothetical protein
VAEAKDDLHRRIKTLEYELQTALEEKERAFRYYCVAHNPGTFLLLNAYLYPTRTNIFGSSARRRFTSIRRSAPSGSCSAAATRFATPSLP